MTIREFLSDRLVKMILQLCAATAAVVFLLATGTSPGVIIILLLFFLLICMITQISDYLSCRNRLSELYAIMQGLDRKYLFTECAPPPRTVYEQKLFALMRTSGRAMITAVSDAQASVRDYRDYIESWVHEVKTPITAARLACRRMDHEDRRKFLAELARIEAHVERALYYARAESPEQDCIIHQASLSDIVSQAIGTHRTLLLQNGMKIQTGNLDFTVYTDTKWAVFILGQLLQNAARYHRLPSCRTQAPPIIKSFTIKRMHTYNQSVHSVQRKRGKYIAQIKDSKSLRRNPSAITLCAHPLDRQVQLAVSDNGIGIPAHELPRVFDRGFTGSNGRLRGGSTGMGLYLCHKLADALEIDIHISSKEQKGTVVTLIFPAKQ